jgi:hypothetical protein
MFETEEFLIAIREEGSELVRDSLEGVSQQFNDVVQEVAAGADELEGFSERYGAAAQVAVAGITVAAAGLLSQVPIIGSVFEAFGGIIEAIAYQMDSVLRPALKPVVSLLYDVEAVIYEAEGPLADFLAILVSLVAIVISVVGPLFLLVAAVGGMAKAFAAGLVVIKGVALALGGIIGSILSLPAVVLIAAAALIAFAVAWLTNFRGTRDKTNEIIGKIWGYIKGLGKDIVEWAKGIDLSDFIGAFKDIGANVLAYVDTLIGKMTQKGKDIVSNLVSGMVTAVSNAAGWVRDIITNGQGVDMTADISGGGNMNESAFDQGLYNAAQRIQNVEVKMDSYRVQRQTGRAQVSDINARNARP